MKKVLIIVGIIACLGFSAVTTLQAHCTYNIYPLSNFFNQMQGKPIVSCDCPIKYDQEDAFTPQVQSVWSGGVISSKCKRCHHDRTLHNNQ